ncbi:MAG: Holliday junction branch migration protein RuvA [Candidatus Limivivens sp.]|nr:Holliday junction branch migration protein RuvA [Candidatus Limivivens sp.]
MIAYVKGEVVRLTESAVILDVNQIGYRVFITGRDAGRMPAAGSVVKLHTYLNVKEDLMQLYGFLDPDDLEVFRLLLNVSGIGPKAAQGVLTALAADDLRFAILSDDVKTISKAPGIGGKTAKKLILELKDKFSLEDAFEQKLAHGEEAVTSGAMNDARSEAVQALTALGYSASDALKAVKNADTTDEMTTEEVLKAALKQMAFL